MNLHGANGLFLFVRFLVQLRKAHGALRVDRFGDFTLDDGSDVTFWFKVEDGVTDLRGGDRRVHWRIDGSAAGEHDFLLCVNMDHHPVEFALPVPRDRRRWLRIVDTAAWAESADNCWPLERADPMGSRLSVHPYSIAVFEESP